MSAVFKIILILVVVAVSLGLIATIGVTGLAGYAVANAANSTPEEVNQAAERIASFELPEGYAGDYGFSKFGFSVAAYDPGDGHSHLTLAQGPKGLGVQQGTLEKMLNQARPGDSDRTTRLTVVETRTVILRGEETILVVQDGTSGDGTAYRQATATFNGKSGPALVILEEPLSRWDDARVTAFLASIQ